MTEDIVRDGAAVKQSLSDQAATALQTVTNSWLQRRGHLAPPGVLTKQQKQDFQDCFLLLDTEKTGRLNADNLTSAFQLLNIETCSSDVRELIAAVDRKSTGYISYDDFEAVMARSLLQHTRSVEAAVDLSATIRLQPDFSALPFHEIARAFRRKKMMAEVMGGGKSRQQLLNRHADRYANDETNGRSMLATKLHLEIERLRDASAHAKQKPQSPRKPAPLTIRLGSIAKHLPLEMRLAVADAVAYDPPTSRESTERLPASSSPPASANQGVPDVCPRSPREEEESRDRVPGGREATVASSQGLPRGNSSSSSARKESGGESSGQSHSSQLSSQQTPFVARPEPMTKQQREQGLRQLSFPAQIAVPHMGLHQSESSRPHSTWQDPPVLTPREVAVEQLISHQLQAGTRQHGPVSIHFAQPQSPVTPQSSKPGSPEAHLASASNATRRSSLPEVPLPASASQAQRWVSKYEEEAPEVTVEVGDDGLPVGVFERHKLSPRKTAGTVTHQQHLDAWRLSELRTFRQQQKKQEEEEQAGSGGVTADAESVCGATHGDDDDEAQTAAITPAAVSVRHAVQPSRKLTADCKLADIAASTAAAAGSAVQRMFTLPTVESEMAPNSAVAGESTEFGGRVKLEENIWGGLGGFGKNGRSKAASSSAALQTPRPMRSTRVQQSAEVGLPSMARQLWQHSLQQPALKVRAMQGSGGSLNAAALLTLAGQRCDPIVPQLNVARATQGKSGLTYREEICC
ncbi:TPA: hypothetical protein ACH3X2_013428 [Trebouxia sp. C0005]|nr:MAG: calcium-binding 2-like [Trebouxia sp. A1-2]